MTQHRRIPRLLQLDKDLRPVGFVSYVEANAEPGPQPVVCMRCADGAAVVPSVRDVCQHCLAVVWLSRTTEVMLTQLARPTIVCMQCVGLRPDAGS